jgi:hypothetical protein
MNEQVECTYCYQRFARDDEKLRWEDVILPDKRLIVVWVCPVCGNRDEAH